MGDHTRRLFCAMPKDLERMWIIAQNAHELKGNIAALREKVQKFRDDALSKWEVLEDKPVYRDKWGVPCAAPPSVKFSKLENSFKGHEKEHAENTDERCDNSWTIPLDSHNSEVQAVMKISPRKALVDKRYTPAKTEQCETELGVEEVEDPVDGENMPQSSESSEATHDVDLSTTETQSDHCSVESNGAKGTIEKYIIGKSKSELADVGTSIKTIGPSENDVIKVHLEAPCQARNEVKIIFGNDICNKNSQIWSSTHTPFPAQYCLPCSDIAERPVSHIKDDEERELTKRRQNNYKKKYRQKSRKKSRSIPKKKKNETTHPKAWGSSTSVSEKKNCDAESPAKKSKQKDSKMKLEYKHLPEKNQVKADLTAGVARYPLNQKVTKKSSSDLFSMKNVTPKKKGSFLDELESFAEEQKDRKCETSTTKLRQGDRSKDGSQLAVTETAEKRRSSKFPDVSLDPISLQTLDSAPMVKSSLTISIPKRSQQEKMDKNEPLLESILNMDSSVSECSQDRSITTESEQLKVGSESPREQKLRVNNETFEAIKNILDQSGIFGKQSASINDKLCLVLSHSGEKLNDSPLVKKYTRRVPTKESKSPEQDLLHHGPTLTPTVDNESGHGQFEPDPNCDLSSSFVGTPVLTSTRRDNNVLDLQNDLSEDEVFRKSVSSTDSESGSVTSSALGLDYSSRLSTDECNEAVESPAAETIPIPTRETSNDTEEKTFPACGADHQAPTKGLNPSGIFSRSNFANNLHSSSDSRRDRHHRGHRKSRHRTVDERRKFKDDKYHDARRKDSSGREHSREHSSQKSTISCRVQPSVGGSYRDRGGRKVEECRSLQKCTKPGQEDLSNSVRVNSRFSWYVHHDVSSGSLSSSTQTSNSSGGQRDRVHSSTASDERKKFNRAGQEPEKPDRRKGYSGGQTSFSMESHARNTQVSLVELVNHYYGLPS